VLGYQVRSRSTLIAELVAYCGLDYVFIESEHFVYNIETAENVIRAVQLGGSVPIVRIPSHESGLILQMLEAGVMGIIFPHIDTKEQAIFAVNEVKYAPIGKRGFGDAARASKYGFVPTKDYLRYANENLMVIGMIESLEGISNLDSILTSGIDVLRVGSRDLSQDMGYGGEVTKEVVEAVDFICRNIKGSDVILGDCGLGGMTSLEDFQRSYERGCRMFTVGSDMASIKKALMVSVSNFAGYKVNFLKEHPNRWQV